MERDFDGAGLLHAFAQTSDGVRDMRGGLPDGNREKPGRRRNPEKHRVAGKSAGQRKGRGQQHETGARQFPQGA